MAELEQPYTFYERMNEEFLLNASNEGVYAFYEARSKMERIGDGRRSVNKRTEEALIARDDPIVSLALAQFSRDELISFRYFSMLDRRNIGLNCAVLNNPAVLSPHSTIVRAFFYMGGEQFPLGWIAEAFQEELDALFSNPYFEILFTDVWFSPRKDLPSLFDSFPSEARKEIVRALARSRNISSMEEFDGRDFFGGLDEHKYRTAYKQLLKIGTTVELERPWPHLLIELISKFPTSDHIFNRLSFERDFLEGLAQRWNIIEERKSEFGLDLFEILRTVILSLSDWAATGIITEYLASEDRPFRFAVYRSAPMKIDQCKVALLKDGVQFLKLVVSNPFVSSDKDLRGKIPALQEFEVALDRCKNEEEFTWYFTVDDMRRQFPMEPVAFHEIHEVVEIPVPSRTFALTSAVCQCSSRGQRCAR